MPKSIANFFKLENNDDPPQYGFASTLRRHNAVLAKHRSHTMMDFAKALADFKDDLDVEEVDEDYVEDKYSMEFAEIRCSRCNKDVKNGDELTKHILDAHCRNKSDRILYNMTKTIRPSVSAIITESMGNQSKKTSMKKKFVNSNHVLTLNIASPLCAWLAHPSLKLFLNELPYTKATWKHKLVTYEMESEVEGEENRTIIFAFTWHDRQVNKLKAARKLKRDNKRDKEMSDKCAQVTLAQDDLFLKKRTAEEDRYLAKALGLPDDYTQEQLQKVIQDNTVVPVQNEAPNSYNDVQAKDGHIMTKEERKLISTLSNGYLHVGSRKRQCVQAKKFSFSSF